MRFFKLVATFARGVCSFKMHKQRANEMYFRVTCYLCSIAVTIRADLSLNQPGNRIPLLWHTRSALEHENCNRARPLLVLLSGDESHCLKHLWGT